MNSSARILVSSISGWLLLSLSSLADDPSHYQVGLAKVDITPDYPVRLNGFGNRRLESEGVSQSVFARAMAISQEDSSPLVLIAIDNLGIRGSQVDEVASRLSRSHQLPRENLALTFTHSHCAPKVSGASDNIFSSSIPAEHQRHIDRYTREIVDLMTQAAQQAIDDRKPARLNWSVGSVGFAMNRRPGGGPVDHDLPTLIVRNVDDDTIRGVYVSYACHCVTMRFNKISGDWAGYAAEILERQYPRAVALVSIGAGSDQNPNAIATDDPQVAQRQGREIASEVARLVNAKQRRIEGPLSATLTEIALPLNTLPTRQQWVDIAQNGSRPTDRYNAQTKLAKLDRGESLLTQIDYPIQTWTFGKNLCMTFLAGEVCVDYALRLKGELDRQRFWLNGYSNDFCCYIPSERLVTEGGYGGGAEVPYFALPATLAPGLEKMIVDEVHRQVPQEFHVPAGVRGIAPKSPQESLDCMQTLDTFDVQLVASEPLIRDPVAIDFGLDGFLWVAEMSDYGRGVYEQFDPTGRIRCLRDRDGDGSYDSATTFVDGLRFPTDVKVWRDGLLICDAPDILFARDTDGDGHAESIEKLFSGFEVRNAQARVNSLRWGLDNWLYGACGLFGGELTSHLTGKTISIAGRDFRMHPDTGQIEAVAGRSQQGRDRNDWGDWFGCSNGTLLRYFSDDERYLRRNPFVAATAPRGLTGDSGAYRLFPPKGIVRFELSGMPGKATAACGLGILRDRRWGEQYDGNAFTCEPVHQLVHRIQLTAAGLGFEASRGGDTQETEFLRSTDRWFRPVQARTGPDGALWIVDMYRFVIEHPRWIPQDALAELDVFAGQRRGRIYRVAPRSLLEREKRNYDTKTDTELVSLLESPNGTVRDTAHQILVWRDARDSVEALNKLLEETPHATARIHSLYLLSALEKLTESNILRALNDPHEEVARHAIRLAESLQDESIAVQGAVIRLAEHKNPRVRRQVAWSLGEASRAEVAETLVKLASKREPNASVRSAVLSSLNAENAKRCLDHYLQLPASDRLPVILRPLAKTALRLCGPSQIEEVLAKLAGDDDSPPDMRLLATALDAADARVDDATFQPSQRLRSRVQAIHAKGLQSLDSSSLVLLGRQRGVATHALLHTDAGPSVSVPFVIESIAELIGANQSTPTQVAAIKSVAATGHSAAADTLIQRLMSVSSEARSVILDELLRRDEWTMLLLDSFADGQLPLAILDATRRGKLMSHRKQHVRAAAKQLLQAGGSTSRSAVVQRFLPALGRKADVVAGRKLFRQRCAACHRLEEQGHVVGPDLYSLTNRDPKWLLATILDPNRDVDARYLSWSAVTDDGRVISGMIAGETATSVTLREAGGKNHVLLRSDLEQLRASQVSVMPEGLEAELEIQDFSDLIAYLTEMLGAAERPASQKPLPRHPPEIAPFLLNETLSVERRQEVIDARPGMGPAIIGLLAEGLNPHDSDSNALRVDWIWRVAVAVGKRNDGGEIRDLLDISLPSEGTPIQQWHVVVIGGGIINGLSQQDRWPGRRIDGILAGAPEIKKRWPPMIAFASTIANDAAVKLGTRYDALRIVALGDQTAAIAQLKRYLVEGTEHQLQMGAVSGLCDIESDDVIEPLIDILPLLDQRNRQLAIEGLLRTDKRKAAMDNVIAESRQASAE